MRVGRKWADHKQRHAVLDVNDDTTVSLQEVAIGQKERNINLVDLSVFFPLDIKIQVVDEMALGRVE